MSDEKTRQPVGPNGEVLMKFYGCISRETAEEWLRIVDEGCEQVDEDDPRDSSKSKIS